MTGTKQARQLTRIQIDILSCIYKFRFGTTDLVARSLGKKSGAIIHPRLVILERDGYLARRFDANYRLQHKPAAYYLTPYGLRTLRGLKELSGLSDTAIKNSYKDVTATEQFIAHSLNVYALANHLIALDDKLRYFTKREQAGYEYFPSPPPDGFISIKVKDNEDPKRFFLELIEPDVPAFAIDRLITRLVTYDEEGEWEVTNLPFPPVLLVAATKSVQKQLIKQLRRVIYRTDTEISFFFTSLPAILGATKSKDAVWLSLDEPEEEERLKSLGDLNDDR